MTNNETIERIMKELSSIAEYDGAAGAGVMVVPLYLLRERVRTALTTIAETARTEEQKAFGGCCLCYGKGYSTEQQGRIGGGRFTVRGPKLVYNPCSCDRGKQFKDALATAREEGAEAQREACANVCKQQTGSDMLADDIRSTPLV